MVRSSGAIIKNFCSRSSVWETEIIEMLERAVFRGVVEVWSRAGVTVAVSR